MICGLSKHAYAPCPVSGLWCLPFCWQDCLNWAALTEERSPVWQAWHHMLGGEVAYGHIYVRDRYRCTSPVCNRRDVTPHHIQFRSAGGSDDDDNTAALRSFNDLVAADDRVESLILTIGDGLTLIRKR